MTELPIDSGAVSNSAALTRHFRPYQVVRRQQESERITSFYLEPTDGQAIAPYQAGQYLVFRFNVDGQSVLRHYSVSADSAAQGRLRISVKHEQAPAGSAWPAGVGSTHWHEQVQPGDTVMAAGPMGDFVLDECSERPVVLLSGGVGITPLLCMLQRLVHGSQRKVYFLHACENGEQHAFGHEVQALAQHRSGVTAVFYYRRPASDDLSLPWPYTEGMISREHIQALLPLDDYDVYLCGPSGFMQANYAMLRGLGVAQDRIHYEFFGPATVLETVLEKTDAAASAVLAPEPSLVSDSAVPAADHVRFLPDGRELRWPEACESLLVLAEEAGLNPDFNCRSGLCNTCMCSLLSGQVEYFEEPLDDVPPGKVLLCCARPKGPVVIDLQSGTA